ncbi:hypothetical protein DER46DRAFT_578498 [Fusarium sp. MPI-SDFR-AT-0072]|nr:hypothetical protein DER46DRAFT_578498 [Fusarium sp. MPI-SDFR-AT-0072]KAI7761712.1 hypothetical protein LZL87_013862 [Fusarium oxysporum]
MPLKNTVEGYVYEAGYETSNGLPCDEVITPSSNMAQVASMAFDAIIVGAGFTGLTFRYVEVLRKREGKVLFENADRALGWRGFIDGAIEEGTRVAFDVHKELAASPVTKANL